MRYELSDIETFLAVMELGSVTAAASRLDLSKSVVSKRLRGFEDALGVALFRRGAGWIIATEAGLDLAERLRPLMLGLTAATEAAASGRHGAALSGRLNIAVPMSFGTMYLSNILARFAQAHPGLELSIDYDDDRTRDLARHGFDLGVRVGASVDGALMARKLCEDRMMMVASPDYLAAAGHPLTVRDLTGHRVIHYSHIALSRQWSFHDAGETITPDMSVQITLNNGEAIRDMAVAGLGLAMLPGFIAAPALADGRLTQVLPHLVQPPLPVMAVWPAVNPIPAKLRALIDHLASELAGGKPWSGLTAA